MQGLRTFIHHTNPGGVSHPDTRAIMSAADAALDGPEPLIVPLVGKPGTGKTGLLEYWAGPYRQQERGIALDRQPVLLAEISQTERASLGRSVYTTSTACVTFSSIMYALGELSRQVDPPRDIPRWYREERSLYTDQQFLWLFDQVCREMRRLHVRAIVLDNAQHIDMQTMEALLRLRKRLPGRVGLVLCAQLVKNEKLDEPLGKVFEHARVDAAECEGAIELRPLTREVFYDEVALVILADLEADFEEGVKQHGSFITEALWELTAGDWKSLNSRVRHFNRLLPSPASGKRVITSGIVEQVLGRKLPS
jgi:hypothetical protein